VIPEYLGDSGGFIWRIAKYHGGDRRGGSAIHSTNEGHRAGVRETTGVLGLSMRF